MRLPDDVDFPVRSTPFPNALLDEAMPALRDTEWRVLCVVVRATLGWRGRQAGKRRASDWLTRGQLRRRTGRQSEALSAAVDALVRRGLIEVSDEDGQPLPTPAMRRRARGRLSYRLSPRLLSAGTAGPGEGRKGEHGKSNATKRIRYVKKGSRKPRDLGARADRADTQRWTRAWAVRRDSPAAEPNVGSRRQ